MKTLLGPLYPYCHPQSWHNCGHVGSFSGCRVCAMVEKQGRAVRSTWNSVLCNIHVLMEITLLLQVVLDVTKAWAFVPGKTKAAITSTFHFFFYGLILAWSLAQNPHVWISFFGPSYQDHGFRHLGGDEALFLLPQSQASCFYVSGSLCPLLSSSTVTISNFTSVVLDPCHRRAFENVFFLAYHSWCKEGCSLLMYLPHLPLCHSYQIIPFWGWNQDYEALPAF